MLSLLFEHLSLGLKIDFKLLDAIWLSLVKFDVEGSIAFVGCVDAELHQSVYASLQESVVLLAHADVAVVTATSFLQGLL